MNRKSLARTSSQPGKTQTINYYNINDEIYFVDLPGYGYAQANEHVKAQWGKMIEDYLHKSKQLKLVFLLIDIRHAPSENDRIMYDWIRRNGYDPIIIATKLDKTPQSDTEAGEVSAPPCRPERIHRSYLIPHRRNREGKKSTRSWTVSWLQRILHRNRQ